MHGFNPRAREGRDSCFYAEGYDLGMFQSTRPRGARQDVIKLNYGREYVSIHAPARGATPEPDLTTYNEEVSIHAPARGATEGVQCDCVCGGVFQSTRPRGARLEQVRRLTYEDGSFNPRAREGRD